MKELQDYIESLIRFGREESWIPDLTVEQIANIHVLSRKALETILNET